MDIYARESEKINKLIGQGDQFGIMASHSRLTDNENSKTFLISPGWGTAPMVFINRTFSSSKSASLKRFVMASSVLASPCFITVLYTADRRSAGIVDSPLQWESNLSRASASVGVSLRPMTLRAKPLRRASR